MRSAVQNLISAAKSMLEVVETDDAIPEAIEAKLREAIEACQTKEGGEIITKDDITCLMQRGFVVALKMGTEEESRKHTRAQLEAIVNRALLTKAMGPRLAELRSKAEKLNDTEWRDGYLDALQDIERKP